MPLTLDLKPQTEKTLREQAKASGKEMPAYATELLESRVDLFEALTKAMLSTEPLLSRPKKARPRFDHYLLALMRAAEAGSRNPSDGSSRVEIALDLYRNHAVSTGVAAELAGISVSEFLDILNREGMSPLQYSAEEAIAEANAA